jgi:hypothetical protein
MDTESNTVLYEKPIIKEDLPVDGTAIQYNLYFPPQQSSTEPSSHSHQLKYESNDLPISLTTLTKFTSLMMTVILLSCGYQACESGRYKCNL